MPTLSPYLYLACFVVGLALGMFLENEFHLASQVISARQQTTAAQKGEVKIIHDTQIITKVIHGTKDPCVSTAVPADITKLLR